MSTAEPMFTFSNNLMRGIAICGILNIFSVSCCTTMNTPQCLCTACWVCHSGLLAIFLPPPEIRLPFR